jgi:hypothetical protein
MRMPNKECLIWKKKYNSVTDKAFDSGDLKYRMQVNRTKNIGSYFKFETHTISDVRIDIGEYEDESDTISLLLKDCGREIYLSLLEELECIGDNTYMTKYT